ncbi:hypothetical protein [Beijerinckia sp. L45]|uniref:hypothetical protein n=1 Tax=Beijerinckia sp. L45 TaxID=1641855 RepID=UPI00131C15E4|nr:hypothetical protein [Beijerinckia sp. L45]
MPDSNIVQFPNRSELNQGGDRSALLLSKISVALRAMKDLHAELESLRAMLKAQNGEALPD